MAHMKRHEEGVGQEGVWMSTVNRGSLALEAWRREYATLCRIGSKFQSADTERAVPS